MLAPGVVQIRSAAEELVYSLIPTTTPAPAAATPPPPPLAPPPPPPPLPPLRAADSDVTDLLAEYGGSGLVEFPELVDKGPAATAAAAATATATATATAGSAATTEKPKKAVRPRTHGTSRAVGHIRDPFYLHAEWHGIGMLFTP